MTSILWNWLARQLIGIKAIKEHIIKRFGHVASMESQEWQLHIDHVSNPQDD